MREVFLLMGIYRALISYNFNCGIHLRPLAGKINPKGEDSGHCDQQLLVVADGIGSWKNFGVDSSIYSQGLVTGIKNLFARNTRLYTSQPGDLVKAARTTVSAPGSSTVVLATLSGNTLRVVYLGDSDYLILRKNGKYYETVFKSSPQQHRFNMPYQLSANIDNTYLMQRNEHTVISGDIIILGSDGLFDNLFVDIIVQIINTHLTQSPVELAKMLTEAAESYSAQTVNPTPYSWNARLHGLQHNGGKKDDITSIVAYIN